MTDAAGVEPRGGGALALPGAIALVLLALPFYGGLLSLDGAPLDTDYGRIFLPPLLRAREALFDGQVLLWDAQRFCGTPHWSLPNTAPAWPPLLIGMALFGAVGGVNLVMLLHLAFGTWGVMKLARAFGAGGVGAWLAGALYVYSPMTRLFAFNLPMETMAMSVIPWAFLLLTRLRAGWDWRRVGILGGLLWACVPWVGGYIILLYGVLAFGVFACVQALASPPEGPGASRGTALARSIGALLVLGVTFAVTSAGRLIPLSRWTALTDRKEPISYDTSLEGAMGWSELVEQLGDEGWALLVLCALAGFGAVCTLARGGASRRAAGGVVAMWVVFLVLIVLGMGLVQRPLYDWLPGYDRIREPKRVWSVIPAVLPPLAGVGLTRLGGWLARSPMSTLARPGVPAAVAFLALLVALGFENHRGWRVFEVISVSERLEKNALHADLAQRAETETMFRTVDARDTRPKLKRTADLVRAGHGLQSVEGVIGNILVHKYDDDFVRAGWLFGPRIWGLMNCRYVTSQVPLDEAFLVLIGEFEEDPDELNPGNDGPYLYENRAALPRALLTTSAIALVEGDADEGRRLLMDGGWKPRRSTVVRVTAEEVADDALLGRFDAVVSGASFAQGDGAALERRVDGLDATWSVMPRPDQKRQAVRLAPEPAPAKPLDDPEYGWRTARVDVGAPERDAWLVLADTFAIYPGWTAEVDGEPTRLYQANGAATAIPIPKGSREVRLAYTPDGLWPGLGISAAGLGIAAILLAGLRRKRSGAEEGAGDPGVRSA